MNMNDERQNALYEMTNCLKQLAPSVNQKFYYDSDIYPLLFRVVSMHLKTKGLKRTLDYFDNVADAQRFFCKRLEEADEDSCQ